MSVNDSVSVNLQDVNVFIVDDEDLLAWGMETELKAHGAQVTRAASVRQALDRFPGANADVVVCDLRLPDGNGMELLQRWRKLAPNVPVILVTAHGAIDSAVSALRLGAFDYLQKPFNMKDLVAAVRRASEISTLRHKVSRMQGIELVSDDVQIIGESTRMKRVRENLRKIAQSKANTILILGESGTGKELAARALHEWSDRKNEPFVEINCASIPENLMESELFGYEKGAFTDARERKLGLFEIARNGTVFLDEVGELPLKLQAKLLRALEYHRFKRIGGTKDIAFSARIVAATNRHLLNEVSAQRFRADLYYRLNVLPVNLPSLRERKEDIQALAEFLIRKHAKELEMQPPKVVPATVEFMAQYDWPGNVRELSNALQRALVLFSPTELLPEHLELDDWHDLENPTIVPATSSTTATNAASHADRSGSAPTSQTLSGRDTFQLPDAGINLETLERSLLEQALERSRNNQTKAAKLLGISRHTLRYRLEKHGLAQPHQEE